MTTAFAIKVFVELIVCLLIVYGFVHESEVVEFERFVVWCIKHPKTVKTNVKNYYKNK